MAISRAVRLQFRRSAPEVAACLWCAAVINAGAVSAPTLLHDVTAHSEQGLMPIIPLVLDPGFIVERVSAPPDDLDPLLSSGDPAVSTTGPFGTATTYVADSDVGVVRKRGSAHHGSTSEFVVGLVRPTAVALVSSGYFEDCMLINDSPHVWLIRPRRIHDLNSDGQVDAADLGFLLSQWGSCPEPTEPCHADFNGDLHVGSEDLMQLLNDWG